VIVEDSALNGRRLFEEAESLMKNPERLHRMRSAAQHLGRPNAAADLAEVVLSRS
jgi:UDP-N-acetylglucosamine:LPS N-acetylglucosamine transferase